MNLLIVDDEVYALQGILDAIDWRKLPFENVLTANSLSQSVSIFEKQKIDVLVCDIEMPFGSGLDLVEWVRKNSPDTECIFLTCHDEFDFARQAIQLQCRDYLLKPVEPDRFVEILSNVVSLIQEKIKITQLEEYGRVYIKNISEVVRQENEEQIDPIQVIEEYIRENLSEQLTVESLSNLVYFSPDYLTRIFKKKHKKSVLDYITEKRMLLAKELMNEGTLTVTKISAKVGYPNYSYFTKSFKKFFGETPREYLARKS
ncbi:MAG: response regulator [Lachnospiraceae bacterium]